jgi:hypothetical protein
MTLLPAEFFRITSLYPSGTAAPGRLSDTKYNKASRARWNGAQLTLRGHQPLETVQTQTTKRNGLEIDTIMLDQH